MLPRQHAFTADELTAEPAAAPPARTRRKGWRLVADAPEAELADVRNRGGARRGLILVLVAGGLFWAGVAALVLFLRG